jgi:hypothetical protein
MIAVWFVCFLFDDTVEFPRFLSWLREGGGAIENQSIKFQPSQLSLLDECTGKDFILLPFPFQQHDMVVLVREGVYRSVSYVLQCGTIISPPALGE